METKQKKSLLCAESYEILKPKMDMIYRLLSNGDKVQYQYDKTKQKDTFKVCWRTFDNIKLNRWASKKMVCNVIKGFGMKHDEQLWIETGVIKILQDEK